MQFSLTNSEIHKLINIHFLADFTNAEMLVATFKTDPEIAREISSESFDKFSGMFKILCQRF